MPRYRFPKVSNIEYPLDLSVSETNPTVLSIQWGTDAILTKGLAPAGSAAVRRLWEVRRPAYEPRRIVDAGYEGICGRAGDTTRREDERRSESYYGFSVSGL